MRTPRIATMLLLIAFAALAFAALQTWRRDRSMRPRPAERMARSLLEARAGASRTNYLSSRDDLYTAGIVAAALWASARPRRRG